MWNVAMGGTARPARLAVAAVALRPGADDLALGMTAKAVQMHGGYGYSRDYRVERLMRDAKVTQIREGTNEVHRQLTGRSFIEK